MAKLSKHYKDLDSIPVQDLAWAAGFIDGEGSVCLVRSGTNRGYTKIFSLILTASQSEPTPVKKLYNIFGGAIGCRSCKPVRSGRVWEWRTSGKRAALILERLLPFLTSKLIQAELAIEYWDLPWRGMKGWKVERTDEQKEIDETFFWMLKVAKPSNWPKGEVFHRYDDIAEHVLFEGAEFIEYGEAKVQIH